MGLKRKLSLLWMDEKSKDFTKDDFIQKTEALNELKNKSFKIVHIYKISICAI